MIETPRAPAARSRGRGARTRRRQARRRLVHGDDLRVFHDGARDLDDLALGDLQRLDRRGGIDPGSSRSRTWRARRSCSPRLTSIPPAEVSGRPRNMFCATVSSGTCCSSWWIIAMPATRAATGPRGRSAGRRPRSFPRSAEGRRRGSSAASTCRRRSPEQACTSPGSTVSDTPSSARTTPNLLEMPARCRRG